MEREGRKNLGTLWSILGFLKPYKLRMLCAGTALIFTAAATLSLGHGLQVLIDQGFGGGTSANLKSAIMLLVTISAAMAVGTFVRFYFMTPFWVRYFRN